jgi:hypothetical protein
MHGLMPLIEQALREPERVIQSLSDSDVELFYRLLPKRRVGIQWLCVVVKHRPEDAFLLTAYLTNQPKKGKVLWHAK